MYYNRRGFKTIDLSIPTYYKIRVSLVRCSIFYIVIVILRFATFRCDLNNDDERRWSVFAAKNSSDTAGVGAGDAWDAYGGLTRQINIIFTPPPVVF